MIDRRPPAERVIPSIHRRRLSVGEAGSDELFGAGLMDRLANSAELRWMPLFYGITAGLSCLVIVQLLVLFVFTL